MPESCILVLDPSEYMRNGDYFPTRFEAQQDAARWLIADITTSNPESTVGVIAGTSVLVSTTNNIGQLFQAVKSGVQSYTKTLELETSLQVACMALKHRRNKVGSQRIVLFVGSPVPEKNNFAKLAKSLRKNNVTLQIITLGEEQNQESLEILSNNTGEDSKIISIPKKAVPCDFLAATAQFATSSVPAGYGSDNMMDPSMDPELAMALRVSLEEERSRQQSMSGSNEVREVDDESAMMQQALALSLEESTDGNLVSNDESIRDSMARRSELLSTVDEADESHGEVGVNRLEEVVVESYSGGEPQALKVTMETPQSRTDISEPFTLVEYTDDSDFPSILSMEQEREEENPKEPSTLSNPPQQEYLSIVKEEGESRVLGGGDDDELVEQHEPESETNSVHMVHVEDANHLDESADNWEDEPVDNTPTKSDDDQMPEEEGWENEPRLNLVATTFFQYEEESLLLTSPSSIAKTKTDDEERKESLVERDDHIQSLMLPPMPSVPPPLPPTLPPADHLSSPNALPKVESSESQNWSHINEALDEYYTASSTLSSSPKPEQLPPSPSTPTPLQGHPLLFPPSTPEESHKIRSCWSNLDEAFDEYNSAINQISNYLPTTVGRISPFLQPTSNPDVVPREEYTNLGEELVEAKKALAIMQGIALEKDEMLASLREIMGTMHLGNHCRKESKDGKKKGLSQFDVDAEDYADSEAERKLTDSLIQEIRKKNRNLESLRLSLEINQTSLNTSNTPNAVSGTPSARLTEKRRRKRELEKLRNKFSSVSLIKTHEQENKKEKSNE